MLAERVASEGSCRSWRGSIMPHKERSAHQGRVIRRWAISVGLIRVSIEPASRVAPDNLLTKPLAGGDSHHKQLTIYFSIEAYLRTGSPKTFGTTKRAIYMIIRLIVYFGVSLLQTNQFSFQEGQILNIAYHRTARARTSVAPVRLRQ